MASQARQMAADGLGRSLDCSDAQGVSDRLQPTSRRRPSDENKLGIAQADWGGLTGNPRWQTPWAKMARAMSGITTIETMLERS